MATKEVKTKRVILDTQQGGYECQWCGRVMAENEHQVVGGDGSSIFVCCEKCLEEGELDMYAPM